MRGSAWLIKRICMLRHAILFDLSVQRTFTDPQHLRGAPSVSFRLLQRRLDHCSLDVGHLGPRRDRHHVRGQRLIARLDRRHPRTRYERRRSHLTDPTVPSRSHGRLRRLLVETTTKLLHLQLELEQAPKNELELTALGALL